jgi:phospholipase/carboxylesterase
VIRAGAEGRAARWGMVLLHGRGSSPFDMLQIVHILDLPTLAVVAPEAPGRSWWPTSFLAPTAVMEPPLAAAMAEVRFAVQALREEGLTDNRIWLAGFSQGAVLALEFFAREGRGLAGVFAMSGALIGTGDAPGGPEAELYGHADKTFDYPVKSKAAKVWISVHSQDPHIPLARAKQSAEVLKRLGADVKLHVEPGQGHSVLEADFDRMRALLSKG